MKNKSLLYLIIIIIFTIAISITSYFTYQYLTNKKDTNVTKGIFTKETMPRVDASLATQPLMDAFYANFMGIDLSDVKLDYTNTHPSYLNLVDNKTDLIIVTEPSEEELAYAQSKNIELEVTKVVNEAFVFFVNKNNSIDNLSIKDIQDIYSGKTTNWSTLGGSNLAVKAYQRPVNSGSQTGMLSLVMKNIPMKEPEKDELIDTMVGIIQWVANFTGDAPGIGYSYYYYANTMYANEDIKFIGIDGIKPTNKTIAEESYPFMTAYYIVTRKNETNSNVQKLKEAMLSKQGKEIASSAGYVPGK